MTTTAQPRSTGAAARILEEGYGPGAWHGPDMRAALADVSAADAFRRPAPGRHHIAEIAVHHAYYVHSVRERLTGGTIEAFPFAGEDWFPLEAGAADWETIRTLVDTEHGRLATLVDDIGKGRTDSPLNESERVDLALGITCHAVYHAGQVQLVRTLIGDA